MLTRISLPTLMGVVLRYLPVILGVAVISGVIAYLRSENAPLTYSSRVSFTPQGRKAPTGAGALAAQFGLGSALDAAQSPQFYVELLSSREIRRRIAQGSYTVGGETGRTGDLATALRVSTSDPRARLDPAIAFVREAMTPQLSPPTGIVTVTVRTHDPVLSAQLATRTLESVDAFNRENARELARQQRDFAQQGLQDYRDELRAAELRLQAYLSANRDATSPGANLQRERLTREVALRQGMYTTVVQAYEQARMEESRDAPQITIIDRADTPRSPDARGSLRRAKLAALLGGILAVVLVMLIELLRATRNPHHGWYAEFLEARRSGLRAAALKRTEGTQAAP